MYTPVNLFYYIKVGFQGSNYCVFSWCFMYSQRIKVKTFNFGTSLVCLLKVKLHPFQWRFNKKNMLPWIVFVVLCTAATTIYSEFELTPRSTNVYSKKGESGRWAERGWGRRIMKKYTWCSLTIYSTVSHDSVWDSESADPTVEVCKLVWICPKDTFSFGTSSSLWFWSSIFKVDILNDLQNTPIPWNRVYKPQSVARNLYHHKSTKINYRIDLKYSDALTPYIS